MLRLGGSPPLRVAGERARAHLYSGAEAGCSAAHSLLVSSVLSQVCLHPYAQPFWLKPFLLTYIWGNLHPRRIRPAARAAAPLMPRALAARALALPLLSLVVEAARFAEPGQRVELRINASLLQRLHEAVGSHACPLRRATALRLESRDGALQVSACSRAGCRRSASAEAWMEQQARRRLPKMRGVVCELVAQLAAGLPARRRPHLASERPPHLASEPPRASLGPLRRGGSLLALGAQRGDFDSGAPNASGAETSRDCVICWEEMREATSLACGHSFCRGCIRAWRQRSNQCPYCLGPITPWVARAERAIDLLVQADMVLVSLAMPVALILGDVETARWIVHVAHHFALALALVDAMMRWCSRS